MENQSDRPEVIRQQMEDTRASLTEKLEALESQVVDTVQIATEAVSETVESVKETVQSVTESVQETAHNIVNSFSISHQADEHPWAVLGVAVGLGGLIGWLVGGRSHKSVEEIKKPRHPTHGNGKHHHRTTNGAGTHSSPARAPETRSAEPAKPGWLEEQVGHLKGLAISVLLGVLRDMATKSLPETLGQRVHDELDSVTRALGGEPFTGPVFPEPEPGEYSWNPEKRDFGEDHGSVPRFSKGMLP